MEQAAENPVNAHDVGAAVLPQTAASRDGASASAACRPCFRPARGYAAAKISVGKADRGRPMRHVEQALLFLLQSQVSSAI